MEGLEIALAVASAGLPSPAPELDSLFSLAETTTTGLGLKELLARGSSFLGTLQPGDSIEVSVFDHLEFSGALDVDEAGLVHVPIIGALRVEGMTPHEVASLLRKRLEDSFLRQAEVSIGLAKRAAASVTVIGAVRGPGTYDLPQSHRMSLHGLLARVNGLTLEADPTRLALIRSSRNGAPECFHLHYDGVIKAHFQGRDVWLKGGDQILVQRLPRAYVYGAVNTPGPVYLRPSTTVATLVLLAGGLLESADASRIRLLTPQDQTGQPVNPETVVAPEQVFWIPSRERIYVIGAVARSGPISLPRAGLTVLQALAEAGWFTGSAKIDDTKILRNVVGEPRIIEVPVSKILAGERSEADYPLLSGDLLSVPERSW